MEILRDKSHSQLRLVDKLNKQRSFMKRAEDAAMKVMPKQKRTRKKLLEWLYSLTSYKNKTSGR